MRSRRRGSKRAHDDDDRQAQRRLDHAVACKRAQPIVFDRRDCSTRRAHKPRREPQPIEGSDHHHGDEECQFDEQKPAIVGAGQGRDDAALRVGLQQGARDVGECEVG